MNFLSPYLPSIEVICLKLKVKNLYAFGSVYTDKFSASSDVDFIVDLGEQSETEYANSYFQLADSLEEILGRSVDLLTVRSLKNPYFIQEVEATKKLLYAA